MQRVPPILKGDLERYGYSVGCKQCEHTRVYGSGKPGIQHNEACRQRISDAMGATEAGEARLERNQLRIGRGVAEYIEHQDKMDPEFRRMIDMEWNLLFH